MGTSVLWTTPDISFGVPLWVIILSILVGLLVLALLTLVMWKVRYMHRNASACIMGSLIILQTH